MCAARRVSSTLARSSTGITTAPRRMCRGLVAPAPGAGAGAGGAVGPPGNQEAGHARDPVWAEVAAWATGIGSLAPPMELVLVAVLAAAAGNK